MAIRSSLVAAGASVLTACYQPEQRVRDIPSQLWDAGETSDSEADAGDKASEYLRFQVLTVSQRGRYSPRNIGVIWVEDVNGKFVRTLEVWANIRARYLRRFNTSSGGNENDAITGATLDAHRVHDVRWDYRDHDGALVPDGPYQLIIEVTDRDASGDSLAIPFEKGPLSQLPMIADVESFVQMSFSRETPLVTDP